MDDIPAGLRLTRAAGWNQLEDDWRLFLTSPGSGGFLAQKDGRAVGSVAFLRYDSFAWIAMMLVDAQERGAGIGTQLMNHALDAVKDAACIGLDATPAGALLYRHFDFMNEYHLARFKCVIEPARFGMPIVKARRMDAADLTDVLRRDRDVFGAGRGELLASLFSRAPECAWIAMNGAEVRGYTFGRPGYLYHQLGPIVADDRDTARALVAYCCSTLPGRRFAIDAPQLDHPWLEWLKSVGFEEERPFVRMFRSGGKRPGVPARQYAITGPEFG